MNRLTRLMTYLAPGRMKAAADAQTALAKAEGARSFDAADLLNRLRGRAATAVLGPKGETAASRPNVLTAARDLDNNVSWVHGVFNAIANNVIGEGIRPEPRVRKKRRSPGDDTLAYDERANDEIKEAWDRWAENGVDLNRKTSFYELQWRVSREVDVAGETLVVMSADPTADVGRIPLVLDHVSAERLDSKDGKTEGGTEIVQGVEYDAIGRIQAYWIWPEDPKDATSPNASSVRVPANRVLHIFDPHRPGAIRGMPRIHSVVNTFEALAQYLDFELTRARVASAFALMVKRGGIPANLLDMNAGEDTTDEAGNPVSIAEGGMLLTGGPNDGFESAAANIHSTAFPDFVKLMIRSAAVGLNVSYGFLARDYSDSNFSAARQQFLEDVRNWRPRQKLIVRGLCVPIANEFYRWAVISGVSPFFQRYRPDEFDLRWRTQGWEWIDPQKEIEADLMAIRGGQKSPQECAQERGRDYYEIVEQIAEAKKFAESAGVDLECFVQEMTLGAPDGTIQENPKAGGKPFGKAV